MSESFLSAGIDIGTSTTCVIFSDIRVENTTGSFHLPKAEIVEKRVRYRSPIYFTPLLSDTELDTQRIGQIIEDEYRKAGIHPQDVQTGAVIITGDTARKNNARRCLEAISAYAGDFVVATAGPKLESILAGKGSGADRYAKEHGQTVCNMDIGGGTTNTATFVRGALADADCLDVGGRLIRFRKSTQKIEYIFPKIKECAERLGIRAAQGTVLTSEQICRITDDMAEAILEKAGIRTGRSRYDFYKTEQEPYAGNQEHIDAISFSGGVGRLIYEELPDNWFAYDDIGVFLANSIKGALRENTVTLVRPAETIGATVIGAGNHAMSVSGSTITITDYEQLPLQNIPIVRLERILDSGMDALRQQLYRKTGWMQGADHDQNVALSINLDRKLRFKDVVSLAEKLIYAADHLIAQQETLILITRDDYGKVLGQSLRVRLPQDRQIICIDSVDVGEGDYIDIGKPLGIGDSVPVVIKTLAFNY